MGDNTAEAIAAVALAILEEEGADAVSMRRVAEAVKITPMAIYHHFPDRQSLLTFVTDREFARLADYMRALPCPKSPKERLLHVMDYYVDYSFAHPRVFDYVFSRFRDDARRFPDDFRAGRSPTMNLVAETVSDAMKAGVIRKDDVWEVAMDLWSFAHGHTALFRAGRFAFDETGFRAFFQRSMRRFLNGLKA